MEFQPGNSKDDPSKPKSKKSRISIDHDTIERNTNSEQNSKGLFHRVTNSVSGLLSNVSWSEWLNNDSSSPKIELRKCSSKFDKSMPGTSFTYPLVTDDPKASITNANPLYPEEGLVGNNKNQMELSYLENKKSEINNFLPSSEFSYFQKPRPINFSTPMLPSMNNNRKTDIIIGNGLNHNPSTSGMQNGTSCFVENSFQLLKKSQNDNQEDNSISKLNGSISSSVGKKRLREQNFHEEFEQHDSNIENTLHSISPLASLPDAPMKKRPRFSISSYGSPVFVKPDLAQNKQDLDDSSLSVFYPGKVMYGGAFNYHKHSTRFANRKSTPRARVTAVTLKPSNNIEDGGLSTAAKRILNCIDKISTPLSNSKRVYFSKTREPDSPSYVADFHKHRPSLKTNGDVSSPPVAKLLTPGKARISHTVPALFENKSISRHEDHIIGGNDSNLSNSQNFNSPSMSTKKTIDHPVEYFANTFTSKQLPIISVDVNERFQPDNFINDSKTTSVVVNSSKSTPTVLSLPLSPVASLVSDSATDFFQKKNQELPAKEGTFSFSMPISFSAPGTLASDLTHLERGQFTFRNPIEIESTASPNVSNFGNSFKPPIGSWECESCLLQNDQSSTKCIACQVAKPSIKLNIESNLVNHPITTVSSNWGTAFMPPIGSWDCQSCLIQNKSDTSKCVACETPRQRSSDSRDCNNTLSSINEPGNVTDLSAFQPPKGSWECQICLINNSDSLATCIACQNPKSSSEKKNIADSWGEKFKPAKDTWECDVCLILNAEDKSACVACQAPKPSKTVHGLSQSISLPLSSNSNLFTAKPNENLCLDKTVGNFKFGCGSIPTSSFGTEFTKPQEEWKCETCLVRNKPMTTKCISCETPKDKSSSTSIVSEALTGNFKFASSSNSNYVPPSKSALSDGTNVGSNLISGGFSFKSTEGFSINGTSNFKPKETSTFTFGLQTSVGKSDGGSSGVVASIFNVPSSSAVSESSSKTNVASEDIVKPTTGSSSPFSFSSSLAGNGTLSFNFGTIANNNEDDKNGNLKKNGNSKDNINNENKLSSSIVENQISNKKDSVNTNDIVHTKSDPKTNILSIKSNEGPNLQSPVDPIFSFGNSAPANLSLFSKSDSKSNSKLDNTPLVGSFTFGKPDSKVTFESTSTFVAKLPVVQTSNEVKEKQPASLFTFGESTINPPVNASFSFGNSSSSLSTDIPKFSFGGSEVKTSLGFGGTSTVDKPPTAPFSFGGAQPAKSSFSFGGESVSNFSFGKSSEPSTGSSLFQFGNQNLTSTTTPINSTETAFGSLESNPFNAFSSSSNPPPAKRVIRKAVRRQMK